MSLPGKIGIIGGLHWHSTIEYYKLINQIIEDKTQHQHSARIHIESLDFEVLKKAQENGNWIVKEKAMIEAAHNLENSGCDFFIIASNTSHRVAEKVQNKVKIPLLHIAESCAKELSGNGVKCFGLLGTRFLMNDKNYCNYFSRIGLDYKLPNTEDIELVHSIIFDNLNRNILLNESREKLVRIIAKFQQSGCSAVLLGCTEFSRVLTQNSSSLMLFDSMQIHARDAANLSLNQ